MQKFNLQELVESGDKPFLARVLINQPENRVVFLTIRAGQAVPEHATDETITVYAISGHVTFFHNGNPVDLRAGEVLWSEGNIHHRLEAREDSTLLVVAVPPSASSEEELDLRGVERPQRHPLVFSKFDALGVGESFILINDHDPVPLNRQMDSMRPEQLSWEYIRRGPDIFRIRVRRIAPLTGTETSPGLPQALWGIQTQR